MEKRVSAKALLPFGVFVGVYLITGWNCQEKCSR